MQASCTRHKFVVFLRWRVLDAIPWFSLSLMRRKFTTSFDGAPHMPCPSFPIHIADLPSSCAAVPRTFFSSVIAGQFSTDFMLNKKRSNHLRTLL